MIELESKIRRNPQVVARELADGEGVLLLHLESGQYHGLNPIGTMIWDLLDRELTVGEIVDAIRGHVDDPPPHLESEVVGFLASIEERDLVVVQ